VPVSLPIRVTYIFSRRWMVRGAARTAMK